MFNSISWQDFFYAVSLTVGGYYVITGLLLYSNEITSFFKQTKSKSISENITQDQTESIDTNDLMGEVKHKPEVNVPHENTVESSELEVQASGEIEEAPDDVVVNSPDALIGRAVTQLLTEIKTLLMEYSDGSKDDIRLVFQTLLCNYPLLRGTSHQQEITLFIHNSLTGNSVHRFTPEEVESWWQEELDQSQSVN